MELRNIQGGTMDMDKITKKKIKKLDNINLQQALKDKHDETNGLTIPQMA